MTKTVYEYDADDGAYIGEQTLDDSDRSPISGTWQIPGNMTEDKPPHPKEGYDLYWHGGKWAQVEKPKPPEPEPTQPAEPQPQEMYIDPEKLDFAEALAGMEMRLSALEAVKGGEGK